LDGEVAVRQRALTGQESLKHDVLQHGRPLVCGVEHQAQRLFQVALADEFLQRFRAEVPLVGNGIAWLGGHKDIPPC